MRQLSGIVEKLRERAGNTVVVGSGEMNEEYRLLDELCEAADRIEELENKLADWMKNQRVSERA
ncbi:hypothetical protein [Caballeronia sp. dw_19]|uniref:hypothetical protein n=1 Tax=Caballeronia sp. dw_19 TaxID=2719791 RepID=UPI001BD26D25|nr:hypothetical protein [Caballeronia sp. dw_19]